MTTTRACDDVSIPKLVLDCEINVRHEFAPVDGDFPRMSDFGVEGGMVEQPT